MGYLAKRWQKEDQAEPQTPWPPQVALTDSQIVTGTTKSGCENHHYEGFGAFCFCGSQFLHTIMCRGRLSLKLIGMLIQAWHAPFFLFTIGKLLELRFANFFAAFINDLSVYRRPSENSSIAIKKIGAVAIWPFITWSSTVLSVQD